MLFLKKSWKDLEQDMKILNLETLVDNVFHVLFILSEDLKIIYLSPSVEKILGYTVEESLQLDLIKGLLAKYPIFNLQNHESQQKEDDKSSKTRELSFIHKDGRTITLEVSCVKRAVGNECRIIGFIRDISKSKELEEALDVSLNAYYCTDSSGNTVWATNYEKEMLKKSSDVKSRSDLYIYEDDREHFLSALRTSKSKTKSGHRFLYNYTCLFFEGDSRESGKRLLIQTASWQIADKEGNEIGVAGVYKNVSQEWDDDRDAVLILRGDSIAFYNKKFSEIFQVESAANNSLYDRLIWEVLDGRDVSKLREKYESSTTSEYRAFFESLFIGLSFKQNIGIPVDGSIKRLNPQNHLYTVIRFIYDAKKKAEIRDKINYETIIKHSSECLAILDETFGIVWHNEPFKELFELTDVAKKRISDLVDEEGKGAVESYLKDHFAGHNQQEQLEFTSITGRGNSIDIRLFSNTIMFSEKPHVFCTLRDITRANKQKRASELISESGRLFSHSTSLKDNFEDIYKILQNYLKARAMAIWVYDSESKKHVLNYCFGDISIAELINTEQGFHDPNLESYGIFKDISVGNKVYQLIEIELKDTQRDSFMGILIGGIMGIFIDRDAKSIEMGKETWAEFAARAIESFKRAAMTEGYQITKKINKIVQEEGSITSQKLLERILGVILDNFGIAQIYLFIFEEQNDNFQLEYHTKMKATVPEEPVYLDRPKSSLIQAIYDRGKRGRRMFYDEDIAMIKENLPLFPISKNASFMVIPLRGQNNSKLGFLLLMGPKNLNNHSPYLTPWDMGVLKHVRIVIQSKIEQLIAERREIAARAITAHSLKVPIQYMTSSISVIERHVQKGDVPHGLYKKSVDLLISGSEVVKRYGQRDELFKKIDSGRIDFRKNKIFNLSKSLSDVANSLNPIAMTERKLSIFFFDDDFTYFVHGDKDALEVVWQSVIDNAIKYSYYAAENDNRAITVAIEDAVPERKKGVRIVIRNYGVGIHPEETGKIFNRYFRGQWNDKRYERPGSGIGLYVAKKIVEFHGGTIRATSNKKPGEEHKTRPAQEVGHVTSIYIILPRHSKVQIEE